MVRRRAIRHSERGTRTRERLGAKPGGRLGVRPERAGVGLRRFQPWRSCRRWFRLRRHHWGRRSAQHRNRAGPRGLAAGGAFARAGQALAASPALGAAAQTSVPPRQHADRRHSGRNRSVSRQWTLPVRDGRGDVLRLHRRVGGEEDFEFEGRSRVYPAQTRSIWPIWLSPPTPKRRSWEPQAAGTLTVSNGTQTAKIALTGDYLSSTWSVSSDGNGGTNVVDPTVSTNWQVMKVGAGGFADGLDDAPDGTMVARTDTNGAYLWNGSSWQQLVTSSSMPAAFIAANPVSSGQGVYEIQMAPSNSNIMYMMFDGYVFVSANKGTTWTQTSFAQVTENPTTTSVCTARKWPSIPTIPTSFTSARRKTASWSRPTAEQTWSQGQRHSGQRNQQRRTIPASPESVRSRDRRRG